MRDGHLGNVTCLKCGWVYFAVSLKYAKDEVDRFNVYFKKLDRKGKALYGNRMSSLDSYLSCWCGNGYRHFRDAKPGDVPNGSTINPILSRDEDLGDLL